MSKYYANITINYMSNGVYKLVSVGEEVPSDVIENWKNSKIDGALSELARRIELKHIVENIKDLDRFTAVERSRDVMAEALNTPKTLSELKEIVLKESEESEIAKSDAIKDIEEAETKIKETENLKIKASDLKEKALESELVKTDAIKEIEEAELKIKETEDLKTKANDLKEKALESELVKTDAIKEIEEAEAKIKETEDLKAKANDLKEKAKKK